MVERKSQQQLLLICPSRARPDLLQIMSESVAKTSSKAHLLVIVDTDDPEVGAYREITSQQGNLMTLEMNSRRVHFMKHYNLAFWRYPEYRYYSCTNDDFIYHTPGWDETLMTEIEQKFGGHGWAYGDDLDRGKHLPTTSVVSGSICRALGWVQVPYLNRCFGDDAVLALGTYVQRLSYVPSVVIEHRHPSIGKNRQDSTYKRGRTAYNYHRDRLVFHFWKNFLLPFNARRVQKLEQ